MSGARSVRCTGLALHGELVCLLCTMSSACLVRLAVLVLYGELIFLHLEVYFHWHGELVCSHRFNRRVVSMVSDGLAVSAVVSAAALA